MWADSGQCLAQLGTAALNTLRTNVKGMGCNFKEFVLICFKLVEGSLELVFATASLFQNVVGGREPRGAIYSW